MGVLKNGASQFTNNVFFIFLLLGWGNPDCPCFSVNVDFAPGNHIGIVDDVANPVDCQARCVANPDCKFWSYSSLIHDVAEYQGRCWLKDTDQPRTAEYKVISGPRICPYVQKK